MSVGQMAQLAGVDLAAAIVLVGALLARLGPVLWLVPFLGGRLAPALVKTGLIAVFGVVFYPRLAPAAGELATAGVGVLVAVLAKELLVGLALGFVMSLVFHGAQAAGWLVDASRGANLAESLVPMQGQRSSPLGSLYFQLAIVLFIALGGHRLFILAIASSYEAIPLGGVVRLGGVGAFAALCMRLTGDVLVVALALAAPVVAALVLSDLTLGWVNRFAPQVSVFFLAMPLKALLAVAVVALSVSLLLGALPPLMDVAVEQVRRAVQLLAAG